MTLCNPLVALLALAAATADDPAEVLKGKGLKALSTVVALESEPEFSKSVARIRATQKAMLDANKEVLAAEKKSKVEQDEVVQLREEYARLSRQYEKTASVDEQNKLIVRMNALGARISTIQLKSGDDKALNELRSAASAARDKYLQLLLDLRRDASEIEEQYKQLAEDESVADAIAAINEEQGKKLELGPSKNFLANVRLIDVAEKKIKTGFIALRGDSNVHWVDVTLNDKVTKSMVFDTGAGLISLPASLAKELEMEPKGTPNLTLKLADGREVRGWMMSLASVRVGEFEVADVECAVLPDDLKEAPPLLGGSFLRNFTYKIDPSGGKLTLSQIDGGDKPAKATPKKKAKSK